MLGRPNNNGQESPGPDREPEPGTRNGNREPDRELRNSISNNIIFKNAMKYYYIINIIYNI